MTEFWYENARHNLFWEDGFFPTNLILVLIGLAIAGIFALRGMKY